jgi:hypothetical protein
MPTGEFGESLSQSGFSYLACDYERVTGSSRVVTPPSTSRGNSPRVRVLRMVLLLFMRSQSGVSIVWPAIITACRGGWVAKAFTNEQENSTLEMPVLLHQLALNPPHEDRSRLSDELEPRGTTGTGPWIRKRLRSGSPALPPGG